MKYDVLRILAETYNKMGQQNMVKPTLEKIPEIYFSKLELAANLLEGKEAVDAAIMQAYISRDDLLDMLSRLSQLYRQDGDAEKAAEMAELTKSVYALFEGRRDTLGFTGREPAWLEETVWPRLAE